MTNEHIPQRFVLIELVMNVKTLADEQIRIRFDQFLGERVERVVKHPVVDGLSEMNGGRKLAERKNCRPVNTTNCM
jgi:hypothetical protein